MLTCPKELQPFVAETFEPPCNRYFSIIEVRAKNVLRNKTLFQISPEGRIWGTFLLKVEKSNSIEGRVLVKCCGTFRLCDIFLRNRF